MDHKKNLEICEAASDGPWDVFHEDNVIVRPGDDDIAFYCAGHEKDGDFIATFDPPTMRAYIERVIELEAVLQKVLDDTEIGVVPRSHLDRIERLLK